jgi:nucleotide-binding universal stress UspA family protein
MRVLVPSDGSQASLAAVRRAARLARERPGLELHLLNVQPPVSGDVATFVGGGTVRAYHKEEGAEELKAARAILDEAGVAYEYHVAIGRAGETIAGYARERQCDEIVMGTSGAGGVKRLLGTTAVDVLEEATVPVTFVKAGTA